MSPEFNDSPKPVKEETAQAPETLSLAETVAPEPQAVILPEGTAVATEALSLVETAAPDSQAGVLPEETAEIAEAPSLVETEIPEPPAAILPEPTPAPGSITGIGVLGDSNSDEYRADDNRGGKYREVTFNWVEQLVMNRGLNFGEWGEWGEPRRSGYEYNWARSSANTSRMLRGGQVAGLAQQIAEGKVSHAVIYIGGRDFHINAGTYEEIYDGSLSDSQIEAKIASILADLSLAVNTLLDAGDVKIVLVNYLDKENAPEALQRFPDPTARHRVSKAIWKVNQGIDDLAEQTGIVVVDINAFSEEIGNRLDENGYLNVGGELISILEKGNEPHHMQLQDRSGHIGTVVSGLLANSLLIEPFNQAFGFDIEPLSDQEILENAGLR